MDFDKGGCRWVAHILEQVIWAEPDNAEVRKLAAAAHTQLANSGGDCHTKLTNAVLVNREGAAAEADATVELERDILSRLALGEIGLVELQGSGARILGDALLVAKLLELLDDFPWWFPIARHGLKQGENG